MTMNIPLAVAPSVRSPGTYVSVNMKAGASAPGGGVRRALLIASKGSAGTITNDTQLVQGVAGADDVKTYLGPGVPGHLAAKAAFAEYGLLQMDLVAPTPASGNQATFTVTFDDSVPVTSQRTVTLDIAGREVSMQWAAGVLDTDAAPLLVAAINAQDEDIPVTAAAVGAVVTGTFKLPGTIGNDCKVALTVSGGAGGSVTLGGVTSGRMTGGTTEASIAAALATVPTKEYDLILVAANGNTDTGTASATTAPGRAKTHVETYRTGASAKLQQAIAGATGALSVAKTGAAQHNYEYLQYIFAANARSLPAEWGGAELGARMREESLDLAVNRIGMPYRATLYGPKDLASTTDGALTDVQVEDALQSGVTPVTYDSTGTPRPARPVTTYFKDTAGNPDARVLDTSRPTGTLGITKDLRSALPAEYPNAKLSKDLEVGDDPPPAGVVQVKQIKKFVESRLRFFVAQGVASGPALAAAIADETLIVRVNPSDPSQCDLVVPVSIVPPLAKFSLVVNHVAAP